LIAYRILVDSHLSDCAAILLQKNGGVLWPKTPSSKPESTNPQKNKAMAMIAEYGLAEMALTASDAFHIMMTGAAKEKALPFELEIHNALTAETLEKAKHDEELHKARNLDDLF
jgi:addiction module RelB/DinJ family antitoxin